MARQHGTTSMYAARCRCALCREALREYQVAYMNRHPEQREKARIRERERYAKQKADSTA